MRNFITILFSILLIKFQDIFCLKLSLTNFDYGRNGPTTWWFHHPEQCDTLLFPVQSPVNLTQFGTSIIPYRPLDYSGYTDQPAKVKFFNNGNSGIMVPDFDKNLPFIKDGPLIPGSRYSLDHILWHWGSDDHSGSEHLIDGISSPLEMQLVHFDSLQFGSYEEALKRENGVVIVSVQYQVEENYSNPFYEAISSALVAVRKPGSLKSLTIDSSSSFGSLKSLFDGVDMGRYYSYHGSLTTPPCTNTVTWIVLRDRIQIGAGQINSFRKLLGLDGKPILNNSRPLQDVYGRTVVSSG